MVGHTARAFSPFTKTVGARRGSRDVFMNERERARAIVPIRAGDGTPLDGPTAGRGERGAATRRTSRRGDRHGGGAHLVLS